MESGKFLLDLVVVLVASRLAAELASRIRQPAVVAEIVAGVVVGPSVLGLAGVSDAIRTLGDLGAILLLFEVGMQTNLSELLRVRGSSLRVAAIGVLAPMVGGYVALRALGADEAVALFVAGGITATSVGITARVFADLRVLATSEARVVLGAAVADDLAGLIVLTIVAGVASRAVTASDIGIVVGGALLFVVVATWAGSWLLPKLVTVADRNSRTDGTLVVMGFVLALVLARLALVARLAPIVGAFIAGLAVSQSSRREDLRRHLSSLGHLLIPIFFLQIGMDTKLDVFGDPSVLAAAGLISGIAIVGKLVSAFGVMPMVADRLIVGIAMVPRGEVGLVFAGLGLAQGVLNSRYYGVLVAVVLVTTLVSPPFLRRRLLRLSVRELNERPTLEPTGGWLVVEGGEVDLRGNPPPALVPRIGLDAALMCTVHRPGERLVKWLSEASRPPFRWDDETRNKFFRLLREGSARSWRFLEITGLIASLLPGVHAALGRRVTDPFDLDPADQAGWSVLDSLLGQLNDPASAPARLWSAVEDQEVVLLGAFGRGALVNEPDPSRAARELSASMGLDGRRASEVAFFVEERRLFALSAGSAHMGEEDFVLELAAHIGNRGRALGLYLLAASENSMEEWERERLDELFELVIRLLGIPELTGASARDFVEHLRLEVARTLSDDESALKHLEGAPRRYLLTHDAGVIRRHLRMIETPLAHHEVRLQAEPGTSSWTVHVVVMDRPGLLSCVAGVFEAGGLKVTESSISTWTTGLAIDVFSVEAPLDIDWSAIREQIARAITGDVARVPPEAVDGSIEIDNRSSPWYTIVNVRASGETGLLRKVASAVTWAGMNVHHAHTTEWADEASTFFITAGSGGKLVPQDEVRLRSALAGSTRPPKGTPAYRTLLRRKSR